MEAKPKLYAVVLIDRPNGSPALKGEIVVVLQEHPTYYTFRQMKDSAQHYLDWGAYKNYIEIIGHDAELSKLQKAIYDID